MKKSEREKMLAGEPYIALDPELGQMHMKAQQLLHALRWRLPSPLEMTEEQAAR